MLFRKEPTMKVTVLCGGPSSEREISLISGKAVIEGLCKARHTVHSSDISPTDLRGLEHPADVIFPVLHGAFGESGELQEILERRGLPFVGSGSKASKLGMDKVAAKRAWGKYKLPTPAYELLSNNGGPKRIEVPCVIKPVDSGSSIDVFICRDPEQVVPACRSVVEKHGKALVEEYIRGTELTVAILEERPLTPIKITTSHEFFDYTAKYVGNDAKHNFNLALPAEVVDRVQELAQRAHETLGCRDMSRIDIMLDEQHQPFLLELNTIPGFTPKSLLPEAAAHDGIDFAALVDRLVCRAFKRGARARAA
jgi:D-alanine-D-alanine ligase